MLEELGHGNYGKVFQGKVKRYNPKLQEEEEIDVAIKVCDSLSFEFNLRQDPLSEENHPARQHCFDLVPGPVYAFPICQSYASNM